MALKREEFLRQLMATFRVEGEEHVQKLTEGLLALERETDPARRAAGTETIYREAHSLKGAARAVGLRDVEIICQALESVLAGVKRGELAPALPLMDLLHGANDLVGRLIGAQGDAAPADLDQIDRFVKELEQAAAGMEIQPPIKRDREQAPAVAVSPPAANPDQPPPAEEVRSNPPEKSAPAPELPPGRDEPAAPHAAAPRAQTIRVNTAELDAILRQSEELAGVRLTLEHRAKKFAELHGIIHQWRREWKKQAPAWREFKKRLTCELEQETRNSRARPFRELLDWLEEQQQRLTRLESQTREMKFQTEQDRRTLELLLEALRGGVHRTLMLPFSHLLASFPKMVRDLARDLAKQVDFSIQGDEIQVDKRILEELKDPLLHLVRNALDHGLESTEDRRRALKPEAGRLRLAIAQASGGKIELTLTDDGRGLSPEKLRQEALRRKLISAEQAGQLSDEQALGLVFHSGFSTSARVTDLSGRGLGMAIVREKIEALGGELRIENQPGLGATFRMLLPSSMATTRGILAQAGGRIFCLPTSGVEHVFRFRAGSLETIQGLPTTVWQGQRISYIPLARLLGLREEAPPDFSANRHYTALLIGHDGMRLALGVERILSEQEIVVKGLGPRIKRLHKIAGTTVLGTGELVPILHLPDLIQSAHEAAGPDSGAQINGEESLAPRRILVADDSITTRTLIKNILEEAGHEVTTAVDGLQALEFLRNNEFDLFLSDVEMPRMGGFELCQTLRMDNKLANLPVILCTSLGSEEDRRRGLDCGANAYLVKRDLEHGQLLELVAQLL